MTADDEGRADRLVAAAARLGVVLAPASALRLLAYLDAMLEENRRTNLTAVRDPAQAEVLHAIDSLAVALAIAEPPARLLDFGTGNGFPGVAAAVLWPQTEVMLCDRTRKKVDAVARALTVAGISAETRWLDLGQARAADPTLLARFDAILVRAVGDPVTVAAAAAPLLARGGQLVLWSTPEVEAPRRLAGHLLRDAVVRYALPAPAARERCLGVWRRA